MVGHCSELGSIEGYVEAFHRSAGNNTYKRLDGTSGSTLVEGLVAEVLPKGMYIVEVPFGNRVTAHLPGAESVRLKRILLGDRVRLKLSPVDPNRGRIIDKL